MKILIVDDSQFTRNLMKKMLSEQEYEIIEAKDGNEGFKMFLEHKPDLVIMDIIMPNKDGITILKQIRENNPNAKVVMCTSLGDQNEFIQDALKSGANDIITKPFKKEELISIIQKMTPDKD
jgi:two-component system, chemotaxis family, chemotaxis protein CheY